MFSTYRKFIKSRILEENSKFKEHKDAFNSDNIARSNLDFGYHILTSNPGNNVTENCLVDDVFEADVKLFFKGFKNVQDALDDALDTAYNLKLRSSNPVHWSGGIKWVAVSSVVPEPVDTNDNTIIINLNYTARIINAVI